MGYRRATILSVEQLEWRNLLAVDPALSISIQPQSNDGEVVSLTLNDTSLAGNIQEWTINWGDGSAPQTISGSPTLAHTILVPHPFDDAAFGSPNTTYNISATAKRMSGSHQDANNTTNITVLDVPMVGGISGDSTVNLSQTYTLNLSASDAGDQIAGWFIDWGDGNFDSPAGTATFAQHAYTTAGPHTILAIVFNSDGSTLEWSKDINVVASTQGTSLESGTLLVTGGTANDTAFVTVTGNTISVNASVNGTNPFVASLSAVQSLVIDLGGGSDIFVAPSNLNVPMTVLGGEGNDLITTGGGADLIEGGAGVDIVYSAGGDDVILGGDGNDDLFGGGGNDVLIGGDGVDMLFGQAGRDLLIGSADEDLLSSGDGEDILIGGSTIYDGYNDLTSTAGIDQIMSIWTGAGSFTARMTALLASPALLANPVFDDDATDIILGGGGRDLIFGDDELDLIALSGLDELIEVV
jgi:Ca2+-binding RTX toxin-like protein